MSIIDFFDDPTGAVLRSYVAERGIESVPEYVTKDASLHPSEVIREEKSIFAWEQGSKFALDTPGDTWLSARYFEKTAHLIPFQYHDHIRDNIKKASTMHGIDIQLDVKIATENLPDDAFLVVEKVPVTDSILKQASEGSVVDGDDGFATIRAYPVDRPESIKTSALWFPRGLVGSLASQRRKVASRLAELCEEHGIDLPYAIADELRPIKRSHLLQNIQQRIGKILDHNQKAAKNNGLLKAAKDSGRSLPYKVEEMSAIDSRFITAYQDLMKMAYEEPVPSRFWDLFGKLDKAAGFDGDSTLIPVSSLNREVEDDMVVTTAKLAGTIVYLPQVMEKVSSEMWQDLAPEVLENMYDFNKVAKMLGTLPEMTQQILLTKVRGY